MKILVINGANLNKLGMRSKDQYGAFTQEDLFKWLYSRWETDEFTFYQSNIEGEIVNRIQSASSEADGLIINPGGYSHTSVAIRDALEICTIPKVEVHLSNIAAREDFRHHSITGAVCNGYITGFREYSYDAAVYLLKRLKEGEHD